MGVGNVDDDALQRMRVKFATAAAAGAVLLAYILRLRTQLAEAREELASARKQLQRKEAFNVSLRRDVETVNRTLNLRIQKASD